MNDQQQQIQQLREQLAAEREQWQLKLDAELRRAAYWNDLYETERTALAAEREKLKGELANGTTLYRQVVTLEKENQQLRKQLAAEREKHSYTESQRNIMSKMGSGLL
jgi:small-conductance mechanosensitive channel